MIVQIPAGWRLGEMSFARDEIVWYRVSEPPVWITTLPQVGANGGTFYTADNTSVTLPATELPSTAVPTIDSGIVAVPNTTEGLLDGVDEGQYRIFSKYRFLGVKRGSVIVNGEGSNIADVQQSHVSVALLPTKSNTQFRRAGYDRIYNAAADVIDSVPSGGPRLRGILVDGGAIWLSTAGGEPYFSSGRK